MLRNGIFGTGVLLLALLAVCPSAMAAAPGKTMITVKNMHCLACARKIAGRLYAVPGVVRVETNVQANRAWVTPQPNRPPSPRAMWDAVRAAGFQPVRLEGPGGVFTAQPN